MPPPVRPQTKRSPLIIDPPLPTDPAVRTIADDVIGKARYAFAVAAAGKTPTTLGSLDKLFADLLATRSPQSRARAQTLAQGMLDAPPALRTHFFGRYGEVGTERYRDVGSDGVDAVVGTPNVSAEALKKALENLHDRRSNVGPVKTHEQLAQLAKAIENISAPEKMKIPDLKKKDDPWEWNWSEEEKDLLAGLEYKTMKVFITYVHCLEETTELSDSDRIAMGGLFTDPHGNVSGVGEFTVSNDFDKGEVVNYGFAKPFATWKLEYSNSGFPFVYAALMTMAEKDDGGFSAFLQKLWGQIEDEVKAAIGAAVGAAVGAAIGAAYAGVGAIVGAVVGAIIGWLISLIDNEDDIMGAAPIVMTLGAASKSYYDWAKLTTPEGQTGTVTFKGHGGHYKVGFSYRVFK